MNRLPLRADSTVTFPMVLVILDLSHILKYPSPPRPKEDGIATV